MFNEDVTRQSPKKQVTWHTLGPWAYDETTLSICRLIVSVEDVQAFQVSPANNSNHAIAYVPCDARRAEQEANARLITAAPDLLQALRAFIDRFIALESAGRLRQLEPAERDEVLAARAAIAKAEGRS